MASLTKCFGCHYHTNSWCITTILSSVDNMQWHSQCLPGCLSSDHNIRETMATSVVFSVVSVEISFYLSTFFLLHCINYINPVGYVRWVWREKLHWTSFVPVWDHGRFLVPEGHIFTSVDILLDRALLDYRIIAPLSPLKHRCEAFLPNCWGGSGGMCV